MVDSISQKIVALLGRDYKPGDTFTSKEIADRMGFKTASGAITGLLFKARAAGALAVDSVEPRTRGVMRHRYRIVDIDRVRTSPTASKGGAANRRILNRSPRVGFPVSEQTDDLVSAVVAEPAPEYSPADTATGDLPSELNTIVGFLTAFGDKVFDRIDRPDLKRVSTDALIDELRRRTAR